MYIEVEQYLHNCYMCKQAKLAQNTYNGLFQLLSVLERPWIDLTIDFMVGLLRSQRYNAILIVVDQLLKKKHYIPCTEKNNSTNAEITADLLMRYIWCYYSLSISFIFNKDPQFTSKMLNSLCKLLRI